MSKERYTITTKGSRTIVHWEGKAGGPRARPTSTGRFEIPGEQPRASRKRSRPPAAKRKRKRR
jgi:hypothetical protein